MRGICFVEQLFYLVPEKIKTQTRRIITPQPDWLDAGKPYCDTNCRVKNKSKTDEDGNLWFSIEPFYKTGEILYLKEPYCVSEHLSVFGSIDFIKIQWKFSQKEKIYVNDFSANLAYKSIIHCQEKSKTGWINKQFVPNYFSSDFPQKIKITNVKCERLQDISDEDCKKEGIAIIKNNQLFKYENHLDKDIYKTPQQAYAALINKINGKGTWESNPFVWVYDFEFLGDKNEWKN